MRKAMTRIVLAVAAVLLVASSARAELIPIGQFQWFELIPEESFGQFSVINQTGPDTTADFPVTNLLTFAVLDIADGGTVNLHIGALVANLNSLDGNAIRPSVTTLIGSIVAPGGPVTLFSNTHAAWNGLWNIISLQLVDKNGGVLTLPTADILETELIYINAERVVPEPVTMSLLGLGVAGILVRRRMTARS